MSITQKILSAIILIVIVMVTIMPTVNAVTNEVLTNGTEEEILYQKNNNKNTEKNEEPTNFEVLLACVLNGEDMSENELKISDVSSIILQKTSKSGLFIEKNSREFLMNLIDKYTNKNYMINEDGFLVEDLKKNKKDINPNYDIYTKKIDQLISSKKTIIVSINETYSQYNKATNEMLKMRIEDDEFVLQFKDSEENNKTDIIVLNKKKYNTNNTDNTPVYLLHKFLEIYYNDEFVNFIDNVNNIEDNMIDDATKENEKIEDDATKEEEKIEDDATKEEEKIDDVATKEEAKKQEIFDTVLYGILFNKENNDNVKLSKINNVKPTKSGIWIEENSREIFLKYLNEHGIYTYSVDNNGYLVCDNIMKENPNLDFIDKTQIDIEIQNVFNSNKTLYISVTSDYLLEQENSIERINLLETEYVKKFVDNNENEILLLNNKFFNNSIKYDIRFLDKFVKKCFSNKNFKNSPSNLRSDTSKTGNMVSDQTVYAGPSSVEYATVGSVDLNEQVYILGQQAGWYHIQYHAGSVQKSGFIPKSTIYNLNVPDSNINEEIMTGGQRYAQQNLAVQSCDNTSISTTLGTVYSGEGLTVLYNYLYTDYNGSYNIAYIEISTASGTKRGYVYTNQLDAPSYATSVARVLEMNTAYSGTDTSYVKLGGAYYNEFVTILAKDDDWVFVEYNTTSGRKRGFMSYSKLYNYNHPGWYNDPATVQRIKTSDTTVKRLWRT